MNRIIILAAPLLLVAACNPSVNVQNDLLATEVALTAGEKAALLYTSLPRCPGPALCSDPATVAKIKSADMTAYQAVLLARANSGMISAAITAVTNLKDVIP